MQIRYTGGLSAFVDAISIHGPLLRPGDAVQFGSACRRSVYAAAERGDIAMVYVDGVLFYPLRHLQSYERRLEARRLAEELVA
jgi:hypothetical protein